MKRLMAAVLAMLVVGLAKKIELKTACWERVDDLVFACGAYKPL